MFCFKENRDKAVKTLKLVKQRGVIAGNLNLNF